MTTSYYIDGLLPKESALLARRYLGLIWAHLSIQPGGTHFNLPIIAPNWQTVFDYQTQVTNQIAVNARTGIITIPADGFYKVSIAMSALVGNGDEWSFEVGINGVQSELISAHNASFNPPKNTTAAAFGILDLVKNSQISIRIQNQNSNTMTIEHAALMVEGV